MSRPQSVRFSIIIPTLGRPGLMDTLQSLIPSGLEPWDEVVVVADGGAPAAHEIARLSGLETHARVKLVDLIPQGGCWGQPGRNRGMAESGGTHLVFTQDDNVLLPDALSGIRDEILDNPLALHFFRVIPQCGATVWGTESVHHGNIDADCGVVPNIPSRLGQWGHSYQGDVDFWTETATHWESNIFWHPVLIAAHSRYLTKEKSDE
jgi:glycosyltransferase involved in cell wall biosynthesis